MRQDCKHFESRTFPNGDAVHRCKLDAAPEAPWKCPDECPLFEKRMMDAGWTVGSFAPPQSPAVEPEPDAEGVAELLSELEGIVDEAAPDIIADVDKRNRSKGLGRITGKSGKKRGKKRR